MQKQVRERSRSAKRGQRCTPFPIAEEEQIEDPLGLCDHRNVSVASSLSSSAAASSSAQRMPSQGEVVRVVPTVFAVPERDETLLQPTHTFGHDTSSVYKARLINGQICVVKFFKKHTSICTRYRCYRLQ